MSVRVIAERRQDQRRVEAEFKAGNEPIPEVDLPDKEHMLKVLTQEFYDVRYAADRADCGFVVWEALPPAVAPSPCKFKFLEALQRQASFWLAKAQYRAHKLTLLDAFYTGLAFTQSQGVDEFLLMGQGTSVVVYTLPGFEFAGDAVRVCQDISYVGKLDRRMRVYLDCRLASDTWYVGHHVKAARGLCANLPCAFGEPTPPYH